MISLPLAIHSAAQVRALDRHAIDDLGIASYTLMTIAGETALRTLRSCWPSARKIVVFCGPGNNGGDGYVVARAAIEQRLDVRVIAFADPQLLQGDALRAWQEFQAAGGRTAQWSDDCLVGAEAIVDAIFGTGLSRRLSDELIARIHRINESRAPILAIDIPSGLDADTGHVHGACVRAERTLSLIGLKLGFYLGEGPDCTGIVTFDALDLPAAALTHVPASALRISEDALSRLLPRRHRTTHKGQQGHVLIIGGSIGMAGAARLSGEAALRVGAGLVTVATRPENIAAVVAQRPELICRGVDRADALESLIEKADVVAIGPGLGQDEWAHSLMRRAVQSDLPMIIDADGLNLLAQFPCRGERRVLTPHPGEAGRLLGISTAEVQDDRLGTVRRIAEQYGGTVVLKGAGTLVMEHGHPPSICDQGNPGMASPGMGDVLTGVIAGIAAQTSELSEAARAGVLVHAMAGDMAARRGERGLLASDLFTYLPTCVNPTQRS
jgi:NAD(P)H-hydrate epimerase